MTVVSVYDRAVGSRGISEKASKEVTLRFEDRSGRGRQPVIPIDSGTHEQVYFYGEWRWVFDAAAY